MCVLGVLLGNRSGWERFAFGGGFWAVPGQGTAVANDIANREQGLSFNPRDQVEGGHGTVIRCGRQGRG